MKYTGNYNLKKPEGTDVVNIDDLNDNADIIDQKIKEIEDSVENIEVPVTSVNGKTGDIELTASDVGAETPSGSQAKADTAETNAKSYTDQEVGTVADDLASHKNDNVKHITSTERNTWNSKADGNHNHDGIYEPVLSADRKRKITFGTSEPIGGFDGDIYFQYE